MRQEVVKRCCQLQVPGPEQEGKSALGTGIARCLQGTKIGAKSFSHPQCPQGGQESSLFILLPLSVESKPERGQILREARQRGQSGQWPCLSQVKDPYPQREGSSWKSKHFN